MTKSVGLKSGSTWRKRRQVVDMATAVVLEPRRLGGVLANYGKRIGTANREWLRSAMNRNIRR
jgi:hypothetical protein